MKNLIFAVLFFSLINCTKKQRIFLYSEDLTQCITVIDENEIRYIIDGKHTGMPISNFIKLNIKNVDSLGDGIHVCWKSNSYDWEVVVDKSIVLESKLDTAKFNFKNNLQVDDIGVPTEIYFRQVNCLVFSYYLMRLSPDNGGHFEFLNK